MKTPRTEKESRATPRTGAAVVEAAFAARLETELHEMSITLARITDCGGIGHESMYDDARELLARHNDAREPLARHKTGEAWMMCLDCGSRICSFDGENDASRKCPYMQEGRCEPL